MFQKIFLILATVFVFATQLQAQTVYDWWKTATFYQIYPRSFMDSDGNGIGDLKGIISRMDHLKDAGMTACWLSPVFKSPQVDTGYDVSDFYMIEPDYGAMYDFEDLIEKANELGIRVMLDFVPNHTSDQHSWFISSENNEPTYRDYYVWRDGKMENDVMVPPNNWISVFGGPAWTFSEKRQQYYLHQFSPQQPDLNYRNEAVVNEMKSVLIYYIGKGVAGFRFDAINHMFEDAEFRDEPRNPAVTDPDNYEYLLHIHTKDLDETFDLVYDWRETIDIFVRDFILPYEVIIMTEAYASTEDTMRYYKDPVSGREGAHMPFNFQLIFNFHRDAKSIDIKNGIFEWLDNMPAGKVADWVAGSHDHSRIASNVGEEKIHMVNTVVLTLPGASITYYGEEIGMHDYRNFVITDNREPNRTPMQWDSSYAAGFTTRDMSHTWLPIHPNYVHVNVESQKNQERSTYRYFQSVSALRKEKAFMEGNFHFEIINDNVFAYTREFSNEQGYMIVVNLGKNEELVDLSVFSSFTNNMWVVTASPFSRFIVGGTAEKNNVSLSSYDTVIFTNEFVAEVTSNPDQTTVLSDITTAAEISTIPTTSTTLGASNICISMFLIIASIILAMTL